MKQDILMTILQQKHKEVAQRKQEVSLEQLKQQAAHCPESRHFVKALEARMKLQQPAIIAEVKKASPSKGVICEDFNPIAIAQAYEAQGASCISVLTDEQFFQGSDEYLVEIKRHVSLPLLRKDFIVDEYQVYEAKCLGADCILLIVAALTDVQLMQYCFLAQQLGMAVLVESHDAEELKRALSLPTPLMGINNRNLRTFETDLATTLNLLPLIPEDKWVITESGIQSQQEIQSMVQQGVFGFLIGESLMRGYQLF